MMKQLEYAESAGTEPLNAFAEVLHAGYEKCAPKHYASIPRDHYLLHLVLAGQGKLRVGQQLYRLRSHQCFLIRPGQEHAYQADAENPWEYIWLGFCGVTDHALHQVYGVAPDAAAFAPASPARLEFHMRRILSALQSPNPLEQLYSRAIAVLALGCLGERHGVADNGRSQPDYVDEAVSYIESHYDNIKSVQAVADYVGLERSYFSKLFQERTGISVARFIAETRMTHAKRLLVDTEYKVHVIANMVGYENYQSFERRFTNLVEMSPSEFRARPAGQRVKAGRFTSAAPSEPPVVSSRTIGPQPIAAEQDPPAEAAEPTKAEAHNQGAQPDPCNRTASGETAGEERARSAQAAAWLSGSRGCPSYIRRRKQRE